MGFPPSRLSRSWMGVKSSSSKIEEPAGGGSGSMAINPPLHSHLGPINCCPCHLPGTPVLSIPQLHSSQVSTAWDVSTRSRQQGQHSKTEDILIENNWLLRLARVCVYVHSKVQDWAVQCFLFVHLRTHRSTSVLDRDNCRCGTFTVI